jgi:arabinofuranan 3-O-arabinosyltransferase
MTLLQNPAQTVPEPTSPPAPAWRARIVATCLALVTLAFLQDPGRIVADTKLDLTVNPWGFMGRSLQLWDPEGFFGQLQNQAYGYLWPMGPFFGLGRTLGLQEWVVQRLWWSVVLVGAFMGMYLLLRALGVGRGWPLLLSALAYALAVRPQSAIGAISVEVWPMAVAPWVLLPLVRGARHGNVVRAAALSALAVTTAGGVNAVAAGAVLPLAIWWLLTLQPGPRRRRLMGWWSGLTALAILWWLIPLVILGRYSPPFLDWIESASFTTSVTDPTTVLRGANHWLAYLGNASMWKAGWLLATEPVFIVATGAVAAAGVAGLAMRSLPHRAFLLGGSLAGLVLVGLGHTGVFSGLGSEQIQTFLDGAGAPVRNVHKFDLVLRIPLTIAFCHVLTTVWPAGRRARWRLIVSSFLVAALVVSWWPAVTGQLARGRSYVALADHWRDASTWLNRVADPGRALIVPGASFGQYVWGRTQDEPLQALGGYPWGIRDAVPLSSAGNIRMLDAVEQRLETGRGSPGLAQYLNRMGVEYLVVRNDLAPGAQAPLPVRVHQALEDSTGLQRVAWFGPIVDDPGSTVTLSEEGLRVSYPAVEVYKVESSNAAPDARALLRPADTAIAVDGSPEALLALADASALGNRATFLADDPESSGLAAAAGVVTDTDRRREITFGYMRGNESPTLTSDEQYTQSRAEHDYRVVGEAGDTTAVPGLTFDASSSASDVDALVRQPRGATPGAAMDGALDTYWRPGQLEEGQPFWEVQYQQAVTLPDSVDIALFNRGTKADTITPLVITTDNGSTSVDAAQTSEWQTVPVTAGPTTSVRIALNDEDADGTFGIREVGLPGEGASTLRLPEGATGDAVLLTARPGDAGQCTIRDTTTICTDALGGFSQDRVGLSRIVNLSTDVVSSPRILVAARDSAQAARAIASRVGLEIRTSSVRTPEVAGSGLAAFDRDIGTAWQAAPDDKKPSISVTLPELRTLRGIRLVNRQSLNASSPLQIQVEAGGELFTGFTDQRGLFRFDAVKTDQFKLTFLSGNQIRSRSELGEKALPLGVSEIALIGADDLRRELPADEVVSLPCGTGPDVLIDGQTVSRTSVSARVEDLVRGETLPAQVCSDPVTIPAGEHRLSVRSSTGYQPLLALFAQDDLFGPTGRPESPSIMNWDATQRQVDVPASDETRILEIAENYNAGWTARAGSVELEPTRVDGWKQAFVVPAGIGGPTDISFAPSTTYRWGLLIGLIGVLAVVAFAVRPPRLDPTPPVGGRTMPRLLAAMVGAAVLLVLGPWGLLVWGAGVLLMRRVSLPVVAFAGVSSAVLLSAAAGVRPASPVVALQGSALAIALAAVALAALRGISTETAHGGRNGSNAEPDAR